MIRASQLTNLIIDYMIDSRDSSRETPYLLSLFTCLGSKWINEARCVGCRLGSTHRICWTILQRVLPHQPFFHPHDKLGCQLRPSWQSSLLAPHTLSLKLWTLTMRNYHGCLRHRSTSSHARGKSFSIFRRLRSVDQAKQSKKTSGLLWWLCLWEVRRL